MKKKIFILFLFSMVLSSCAKDLLFLSGHIRRAYDAVMTTCDPYNLGSVHTCLMISSAFRESLYIYDATAQEMVLAPDPYSPLKERVGPLTDDLTVVVSDDKKFPFMLAFDRAESILYAIRLFPSKDQKMRSFGQPTPQKLANRPFKIGAAEVGNKVVMISTFPKESRVEIMALEKETGRIDSLIASKSIPLDGSPHRIEINQGSVVISDAHHDKIFVLSLANLFEVLTKGALHTVSSINIRMPSNKLYLSRRDVGNGEHLYAVVLNASGKEVKLVNIDQEKVEARMMLDAYPMAGYFPDKNSNTCCDGRSKHWFSIVSIKGDLSYISINKSGDSLLLEKASSVDLTSEGNLALSKVHIIKILGGFIEPDPKVKKENICKNNRQTFYIGSFGNSRSYLHTDPVEEEAHGYSCEGDSSASRFGFKAD